MNSGGKSMKVAQQAAQALIQDVNKEDSVIIEAFGKATDMLFKAIVFSGLPFLIWVLFQFSTLN
jgi:late competence protein required for DNA uptake (superfamily II DNA/RNA helicase)